MTWSAAAAPRLMVWLRFIRRAQAGGPAPSADAVALVAAALGALSPTTAAPPATKLDCMLAAALRSGLTAAEPAASATLAIPPARYAVEAAPARAAPPRAVPAIAPPAALAAPTPAAASPTPAAPTPATARPVPTAAPAPS